MPYFIDNAGLAVHAGLARQAEYIGNSRSANWMHEAVLLASAGHNLATNDARVPESAWRDFDRSAKAVMIDPTADVIYRDLAPLSRNVDIGKLVSEWRKRGDGELEVRTSMDGNHAKPINRGADEFDGATIPVHSTQVGRQWRELAGLRSEGMDALREDVDDALRFVRRRIADDIVNGSRGAEYKNYKSLGIKRNPNTLALNLGAGGVSVNLVTGTLAEAKKAIVAALAALQGTGNNAQGDVTVYLSSEAWFHLIDLSPADNSDKNGIDILKAIPGVSDVKRSAQLVGNEFIAGIVSAEYIKPLVGMPVTSTPIPRATPMDNYNILVWGASGLQIRADVNGRSGWLYASAV